MRPGDEAFVLVESSSDEDAPSLMVGRDDEGRVVISGVSNGGGGGDHPVGRTGGGVA
jgi:hypothetical protein